MCSWAIFLKTSVEGHRVMRICLLSCYDDILAKDSGASIRIFYLAKGLGILGHEVHVVIPTDQQTFEWAQGVIVHGVKGLCPQWILKFVSNLLSISKPNTLFFYDFTFMLRASRLMLQSHIIQIEGGVSAPLLIFFANKVLRKPVAVDCHDTFQALRIRYQNNLRKKLEIFMEEIAYRYATLVLTVSEKDKDLLAPYGVRRNNVVVIPNGVDTESFAPSPKASKFQKRADSEDSCQVIFVGNMEYLPNQEAARCIISYLAPKILSRVSNVRFVMVGKTPTELVVNSSHLIFTGVVKDVAKSLANSDIAISPLFHGSGTRLKILEYLSSGLPVVSTSIGAEGLDVKDGVYILIEDDMNRFGERIVDLIKNEKLRVRLGEAGRQFVKEKYDWRIVSRQLDSVYRLLNDKLKGKRSEILN
jgi:glycosyltransferase involved in cell wall biosynthesis